MKFLFVYLSLVAGTSDAVYKNKNGIKEFGICPTIDSKIRTLITLSLNDCIKECVVRPACKVIGYRRLSKICQLHRQSSSDGIVDKNCVQVNMDTVLTNEAPKGCNGECIDGQVCDTTHGCIYKECEHFHHHGPNTDGTENINEIGSVVREHDVYAECLSNGLWTRIDHAMVNVALIKKSSYFINNAILVSPWWSINLEYNFIVNKYLVHCLHNGLVNVVVWFASSTGSRTLVDNFTEVLSDTYNRSVAPTSSTRYVYMYLTPMDVTLLSFFQECKVELYGLRNVALNKPTEMSSIFYYHYSEFGVDGDTNQDLMIANTCFHTDFEHHPWWLVDLQDLFYISHIVLFNRLDRAMDVRAHDIEVHFGYEKSSLFLVDFIPGILPSVYTKNFALAILTKFAKILIVSKDGQLEILHLCEVELFGNLARQ